jgi:hypothetical protein
LRGFLRGFSRLHPLTTFKRVVSSRVDCTLSAASTKRSTVRPEDEAGIAAELKNGDEGGNQVS